MPTSLGTATTTLFLKSESHKLHQEFTVKADASVNKGDLVKLHTDGTILPLADDEAQVGSVMVGVSLHDAAACELATVACRGYMIMFAEASAALNAGPVKMTAVAGGEGEKVEYANIVTDGQATQAGQSLDSAAADGDEIRVLIG